MSKNIFYRIRKRLFRYKHIIISFIFLIILPLASALILGYEFSANQVNSVPTIIVNHDASATTQNLVKMIESNDTFNVIAYSDNDDDIKKYIYEGKAIAGILIPKNFSEDLLNGKSPKIMSFYDGSQTSVASTAKGKVSETLSTIKMSYLMSIAEGKLGLTPQMAKSTIAPMGYNYRFTGNPTRSLPNFFLQGMVLNVIQMAIVICGALIKEDRSYKKLFIKGLVCSSVGCISTLLSLGVQFKYFGMPFRGNAIYAIILTIIFNIGMVFVGILIKLSKNGDRLQSVMACGSIGICMLISGYTWPTMAMPSIFQVIAKLMPFTYYIFPMRDLSLIGRTYEQVMPNIRWLFIFMIFIWIITYIKFKKQQNNNIDILESASPKEVIKE